MPGQRPVCDDEFLKPVTADFEEPLRRCRRLSHHSRWLVAAASDNGRPHD